MANRGAAFLVLAAAGGAAWWLSRGQADATAYDSADPQPGQWTGYSDFIESYLASSGLTPGQARGVAAGIWAESLMDPDAVNLSSGAYGIGQWLGSRKADLFARYCDPAQLADCHPTLLEQLDYMVWELGGGDHGGAAVLAQQTPADTLDAYIRRFMRPRAGAETSGDLARGTRYLG